MTMALDAAAVGIVEDHLARIATALGRRDAVRNDVLDELRDCLLTATEQHVAGGMAPDVAARAALRDYGDVTRVAPAVVADVTATRARGTALVILGFGPIAAAVWAAAIATASPTTTAAAVPWRAAMSGFGPAVVLAAACALTAYGAASSLRRPRSRLPRAAAVAATVVSVVTDLAALAYITVLVTADSHDRWLIALAAALVSGIRVLLVTRSARSLLPRPPNAAPA